MTTIEEWVQDRQSRELTCGAWQTEAESTAALDEILERLGWFFVYREVEGYYLQPRLGQDRKNPRVDRILVPKRPLIDAGWTHGPVGIECKRSGYKAAKAISQAMDYSRAAWLVEPDIGLWVIPSWFFVWPLVYQHGAIASFQAQHRVGSATPSEHGGLDLSTGTMPFLGQFRADGYVCIGHGLNGRKTGSR